MSCSGIDNCDFSRYSCYSIEDCSHGFEAYFANRTLCSKATQLGQQNICDCTRFFGWKAVDNHCVNTNYSFLLSCGGFLLLLLAMKVMKLYCNLLWTMKSWVKVVYKGKNLPLADKSNSLQTHTKEQRYIAFWLCCFSGLLLNMTQTLFAWRWLLTPFLLMFSNVNNPTRFHTFCQTYLDVFWSTVSVTNLVLMSMTWLEQARNLDIRPPNPNAGRTFRILLRVGICTSILMIILEIVVSGIGGSNYNKAHYFVRELHYLCLAIEGAVLFTYGTRRILKVLNFALENAPGDNQKELILKHKNWVKWVTQICYFTIFSGILTLVVRRATLGLNGVNDQIRDRVTNASVLFSVYLFTSFRNHAQASYCKFILGEIVSSMKRRSSPPRRSHRRVSVDEWGAGPEPESEPEVLFSKTGSVEREMVNINNPYAARKKSSLAIDSNTELSGTAINGKLDALLDQMDIEDPPVIERSQRKSNERSTNTLQNIEIEGL